MKQYPRLATWVGAILGLFMALLANSVFAHAQDDNRGVVTEEFHHTYPLAANGRLELQNINGAVHITAWDQNQVKVDAVKRGDTAEELKEAEIRVNSSSNSISIDTHYPEHDHWFGGHRAASVDYTIMVPRNARLDEVKLINGEFDVTGVSGEVRASCINGKLLARGITGTAKLATINGPLDATFSRVNSQSIELSSVNGSVDLTLPSDAKASIEAATVHGGIENNFGLHTNNHQWVGHDLRGELGGGGAEIKLHNVNGRIDIHHAADGKAMSPAKDTGERREGSV